MEQGAEQMTRHSSLRRKTAHGLCVIFVFSLGWPVLCAPGPEIARVEPIRVAIGPCSDETGKPFGDLAEYAARALSLAFAESQRYRVVSALDTDGSAQFIVASLGELKVLKRPRRVTAKLEAIVRDAETGHAIMRTHASGVARAPGKRTADASLAKAAVDQAAQLAAAQIAQAVDITGHVIGTTKRGMVTIDVGRQRGIKPDTEFKILRDGEEIATVRARNIHERSVDCLIVEAAEGVRCRGGDVARATYIPDTREKKRTKGKDTARIAGIIALIGLATAVVLGETGGRRAPGVVITTVINVGTPDTDVKNDGVDSVVVTAIVEDPAGTPVADGTPVSFAFKTGAGLGTGLLDGGAPPVTILTSGGVGLATVTVTTTDSDTLDLVVTATATDATTSQDVTTESATIDIIP